MAAVIHFSPDADRRHHGAGRLHGRGRQESFSGTSQRSGARSLAEYSLQRMRRHAQHRAGLGTQRKVNRHRGRVRKRGPGRRNGVSSHQQRRDATGAHHDCTHVVSRFELFRYNPSREGASPICVTWAGSRNPAFLVRVSPSQERLVPTLVSQPTRIRAAGTKPKLIDEYIGRVNTKTGNVSVAHMRSPQGWEEPGQTPEFEELTIVLKGTVQVR